MKKVTLYALISAIAIFFGTVTFHASATPMLDNDAPGFTLVDQSGKSISLADYKGKIVVLHWTTAKCPFIQRHYKLDTFNKLYDSFAPKGVVFLAIDSSNFASLDSIKKIADEQKVKYSILEDASGTTGKAYGAKTTPHVFIVNREGRIAYQGAVDNDRFGELTTGRINYIEQALTELLSNKPVTVSSTQQYGCSIKYRD